MNKIFKDFIKEEKGQTVIEWIMILALILIIILKALGDMGTNANNKANTINSKLK